MIIVDDDPIIRKLLGACVMREGFEAIPFEDGLAFLECLRSNWVDLSSRAAAVFMDMSMPRMDGVETIRQLRTFETERGMPRLPACCLSGFAGTEHIARAKKAGFDECIAKPFDRRQIARFFLRHATQ